MAILKNMKDRVDQKVRLSVFNHSNTTKNPGWVRLFNTRRRSSAQLELAIFRDLQTGASTSYTLEGRLGMKQVDSLLSDGILVDIERDEIDEIRTEYLSHRAAEDTTLIIVPTLDCNMNCSYCFVHRRAVRMQPEGADALVRFVQSCAQVSPSLNIEWFGGEPLLSHRLVTETQMRISRIVADHGLTCRAAVSTNGFLLNKRRIRGLVAAGIGRFNITIDGPQRIHDFRRFTKNGAPTFNIILKNFLTAVQHATVRLTIMVDKTNVMHMDEIVHYLAELRFGNRLSVKFKAVTDPPNEQSFDTPSHFEYARTAALQELARRVGLRVQSTFKIRGLCVKNRINTFTIGPDLTLFRCTDSFDKKEGIGFVRNDGELELRETALRWPADEPFSRPDCKKCVLLPLCFGGCPLRRYHYQSNWCPAETRDVGDLLEEVLPVLGPSTSAFPEPLRNP